MLPRRALLPACAAAAFASSAASLRAQPTPPDTAASALAPHRIDLLTALELAGARNLEVQLAREKLAEARANDQAARLQLFPWLSAGITYRQHGDRLQDTAGNILDVDKRSYAAGGVLSAQLDLGNSLYRSLETKQLAKAAEHALEAERDAAAIAAAHEYYDLLRARAAVGVAREALRIATDYEAQVRRAVGAGIAFKGDELRVRVQMQRDRLALRQAEEKQRVLSAVLARTLHLDPTVELVAQDADLVPVHLVDPDTALGPLVEQALARRPESRQTAALLAAARDAENGAAYGPLFPSIGGLAFVGGLAGGKNAELGDLGPSQDYVAVLSWRLGPGGLLDPARIRSSRARRRAAELGAVRTRDEIARQVVESLARVRSLADQITTSEQSLADAGESLRLSEQRQLFGVGAVLEHIQAQQELTRVRNDYVSIIAEYNKAQYALIRSIGGRMPE